MGHPGTYGERWSDAHDVSAPTHADHARARQSTTARREVDEHYARWLGLPDDQVGPFLERLALYDLREQARQAEEATARLRAAESQRARLEGTGELVRLRGRGLARVRPRRDAA